MVLFFDLKKLLQFLEGEIYDVCSMIRSKKILPVSIFGLFNIPK